MKKEIIIIISIVFVIIIVDIFLQNFTQKFFDEISEDLSVLEKMMETAKDKEEIENKIDEIQNKWRKKYDKFACFIEHEEIEKVQTQLISIKANIKNDEYSKSIDDAEKCKFILKHISEKDSFKLVNIL